jgi:ribonuclease P protein component
MRDHSELTLRNQSDFSRVYNHGKSRGGRFAVVLYRKNGLKYSRTAFVASKKVGNSVNRNRARRLMKAAFRAIGSNIVSGYDIIFVARAAIIDCKEKDVEKQLRKSLESEGLLEGINKRNEKR